MTDAKAEHFAQQDDFTLARLVQAFSTSKPKPKPKP
tara:strand:+ start:558 stop:665 length:108 start_codon:yes stop_codon:yes gene_type:complete